MKPVDRHTLVRKLEYLRKQLQRLESFQEKGGDPIGDDVSRAALEHVFGLSIQSVVSCGRMLVALEDWREARDERDALSILAEREVISDDLTERLREAKGLRDAMTLHTEEVDPDVLRHHLQDDPEDFWAFARCMAERLA